MSRCDVHPSCSAEVGRDPSNPAAGSCWCERAISSRADRSCPTPASAASVQRACSHSRCRSPPRADKSLLLGKHVNRGASTRSSVGCFSSRAMRRLSSSWPILAFLTSDYGDGLLQANGSTWGGSFTDVVDVSVDITFQVQAPAGSSEYGEDERLTSLHHGQVCASVLDPQCSHCLTAHRFISFSCQAGSLLALVAKLSTELVATTGIARAPSAVLLASCRLGRRAVPNLCERRGAPYLCAPRCGDLIGASLGCSCPSLLRVPMTQTIHAVSPFCTDIWPTCCGRVVHNVLVDLCFTLHWGLAHGASENGILRHSDSVFGRVGRPLPGSAEGSSSCLQLWWTAALPTVTPAT